MKICVIKDVKANLYLKPFATVNKIEAERSFRAAISDNRAGPLSDYPEDFNLYCLGSFDEDSGELKVEKEELIVQGQQIKNKKEKKND